MNEQCILTTIELNLISQISKYGLKLSCENSL